MNAPIGVFDSGIGGLTVAKEIMRQIDVYKRQQLHIGCCPGKPVILPLLLLQRKR